MNLTTLHNIGNGEAAVIDSMHPQTDYRSPVNTQADTPGTDLQHMVPVDAVILPNPTIGGQFGSRIRNGFSTGFRSLFNRQQAFSGAVAKPPEITNPVIGEVGRSGGAAKLYAGVLDQTVQYNAAMGTPQTNYVTGGMA